MLALILAGLTVVAGPRVFRLDPDALQETRRRVDAKDARLEPALARLRADAREAMEEGPFTVVSKDVTPPSGDKHDYMSQAPYFWRNPATPDGLPYVRRDGERNPEIRRITDREGLRGLIAHTETLALSYYFLGDEAYAARASLLLRTWFLDAKTRMNPHLQYGQGIPGINQGRGIGIIETSGLTRVVDAVGLLAGSKAWTAADQQGLEAWFAEYLRWLRESGHGRDEAATTNNHGTHYDAQVASFALFTGQRELAAQVLGESRQKRIAAQIQPDGRQPRELERTRAWSYSVMNLGGFFTLAALGQRSGVDLWTWESPDGRSLRRALDWLVPFADGKAWPHAQITPWSPRDLAPLLREAALRYREPRYEELIARVDGISREDRLQLLHPAPMLPPPAAEAALGGRLYEVHCASCHGLQGEGGTGPALAVPRLTQAPDFPSLVEVVRRGIEGTEMPRSRLDADEVQQVAAWVQQLGQAPAEPLTGDPQRGARLYHEKGACAQCHAIKGRGGATGPDLTDIGSRRGGRYLKTALTDPEADVPRSFSMARDGVPVNFVQVRAVTRKGSAIAGVRVNEDTFTIQLRDPANRIHSLVKSELQELHKDWGRSLMPAYGKVFTEGELDDLVAFMASLRGE